LREPWLFSLLGDVPGNIEEIIRLCISIKSELVEKDEHDRGARQLLNLGHTVGHAIEKYSAYTISHGRAVAMGLSVICAAAEANGDCEKGVYSAVCEALASLGLPVSCAHPLCELCKLMLSDKKKNGVNITIVIPKKSGQCELKILASEKLYDYLLPAFGDSV